MYVYVYIHVYMCAYGGRGVGKTYICHIWWVVAQQKQNSSWSVIPYLEVVQTHISKIISWPIDCSEITSFCGC